MIRFLITIALFLALVGCHDLDTGTVPSFGGFSLVPNGESQIQVTWTAGSDDFLTPPELQYGIWVVTADGTIDLDSAPDFTTDPGALSWTLTALEAETEYEVLVRAYDGGAYSDATDQQILAATTTAADGGSFSFNALDSDLSITPSGLIAGHALSTNNEDIGVFGGDRLVWYTWSGDTLTASSTENFDLGTDILEAHLVSVTGTNLDDLILLTASGLRYHENQTSGGFRQNEPEFDQFEGNALEGSLDMVLDNDGVLDFFTYTDDARFGYLYQFDEDPDSSNSDPTWLQRARIALGANSVLMRAAYMNDDSAIDLVTFSNGRIAYLEGGENFVYDSEVEIDLVQEFTQTVAGTQETVSFDAATTAVTMTLMDGNGDNHSDIYLFVRDTSQDLTQLLFYAGNGDGSFDALQVTDYQQAVFQSHGFYDADGSGAPELVCPQFPANNAAGIAPGTSGLYPFAGVDYYSYGNSDPVDFAVFADLDGQNRNDMVLTSVRNLTVLRWLQ